MTFPTTALAVKTELNLAGTWTDVSSYTLGTEGFTISRGRRSEGSTADASTCTFTLRNADGRFSPRNPTGAYYGTIGRNTQVRVSLPASTSYLNLTGLGQYASCPDSANLSITGDLDMRADLWASSWRQGFDICGKYASLTNNRSYVLRCQENGTLRFTWSSDGSATVNTDSTVAIPVPISRRLAVRVTLDANNGAGGNTVTFYTSDTMSGSWTQLGDAVVTAGTASMYDSNATVRCGDIEGGEATFGRVKFYEMRIYQGIAGTLRCSPNFTAQSDGTTSFNDAQSNTWTCTGGGASIVGRDYRFHGEISEWPGRWGHSGRDVSVPATASGILRRLGKGSKPLKSAYYRGVAAKVAEVASVQAYWPCEDLAGATSIASGIPGRSPMSISGTPTLASDSTSFPCSAALPDIGSASFSGNVANYVSTGQIQVRMLLAIPAAGITNNAVLLSMRCGGTAVRWEVVYGTASGGSMTLNAYDLWGTSLLSTGSSFSLTGAKTRIGISLTQNGANIDYVLESLGVGSVTGGQITGTLNSRTIADARSVTLAPGKNCSGATMGHVTVQSAVSSAYDLQSQLNAYNGETATDRFLRLCNEESVTAIVVGDSPGAMLMGAQTQTTLVNLLRECETADGGIIYEPRDFFGLAYRSTESLASQTAALTLSYATAQISELEPTEDDQNVVNDVTAVRSSGATSGSSARYTKTSGVLSTLDPPNGVGVYDVSVSVNVNSDSMLDDIASWRVHIGTVDEPRYPAVGIHLAHPTFAASSALTLSAAALDVGDRLVITSPPAWFPPDDISQLVIGFSERLGPKTWDVVYVCQPESPYHVASYNGTARYSSQGSTVNGLHTAPVSSLSVATAAGPLWSDADGDFDIMVSGCRFTVTAITGSSSPQTFTVTLVNGVSKNIASGSEVALFDPLYYVA